MRAPRFTPRQAQLFASLLNWGHVFSCPYSYTFATPYLRKATAVEIAAHYVGLRADLAATTNEITRCASSPQPDFQQIKTLANHALAIELFLRSRADDVEEGCLVVLTDEGRAIAARFRGAAQ